MENNANEVMNFLIDNGAVISVITLEKELRHSNEFVEKVASTGIREFKYAFPKGNNSMNFWNDWNDGKLEFMRADKDGVWLRFYRNGNHHNSYKVPYEIGYRYIPESK